MKIMNKNYFILTNEEAERLKECLIKICNEIRQLKQTPYYKIDTIDYEIEVIEEIFMIDN